MIPLSGDLPKSKGIKSENVDSINVTKGNFHLETWLCSHAEEWSCDGCYNCRASTDC